IDPFLEALMRHDCFGQSDVGAHHCGAGKFLRAFLGLQISDGDFLGFIRIVHDRTPVGGASITNVDSISICSDLQRGRYVQSWGGRLTRLAARRLSTTPDVAVAGSSSDIAPTGLCAASENC